MSKLKYVLLAFYIAQWPITYAGDLAFYQREFPSVAAGLCRQDVAISMLFASFPPTAFVGPFMTGFYQDGLQFTCTWEPRYR